MIVSFDQSEYEVNETSENNSPKGIPIRLNARGNLTGLSFDVPLKVIGGTAKGALLGNAILCFL